MRKVLIVTVVAACASSNALHAYEPVSGQSSAPKTTVIQKATLAIADAGYETETSDGNTGLVISKWFQGTGFMSDQRRYRLRVTVDDTGHYEITAQCQSKETGITATGGWEDKCTEDKRPQFVLDAVTKVSGALK